MVIIPFAGVLFEDVKKEREMVKWEHMKAMDYLREPSTKSGGKRGGAESRAVVFRGGGGAGVGPGQPMDLKSEMTAVTEVSRVHVMRVLRVWCVNMCEGCNSFRW